MHGKPHYCCLEGAKDGTDDARVTDCSTYPHRSVPTASSELVEP